MLLPSYPQSPMWLGQSVMFARTDEARADALREYDAAWERYKADVARYDRAVIVSCWITGIGAITCMSIPFIMWALA